jgi:segregation and condensation protein B
LNPHQIVEAVLFASDAPLTAEEIARADETLDEDRVELALQVLRAEYDDAQRAFQVVEVAEGYQVLTRPEFAPYLERFDNVPRPSRLSGPAIETLAIIAYRQPIGRLEVEYIRGVGASGVIRTLQERRLIDIVGRAETLGRPLLYGTTQHFLEHFGFRSIEDLPRPEELPVVLRDRIPLGLDDGEGGEAEGAGEVAGEDDDAGGDAQLAGASTDEGRATAGDVPEEEADGEGTAVETPDARAQADDEDGTRAS